MLYVAFTNVNNKDNTFDSTIMDQRAVPAR